MIVDHAYSLFPVGQASLDNFMGIIRAKEVLARCLAGQSLDLKASLKEPLFVPENMPALEVLEQFKHSSQRMALVIDEYGGIQGLVTHTDILEALVGDMHLAAELAEPKAVQRQDGSWLIDGMLPIDEFKEILRLDQLPDEKRVGYQTVCGFILSQKGCIPTAGQSFDWCGLRFEVIDMDGLRVDKILVVPVRIDRPP